MVSGSGRGVVRLLTVHGAKGLEAPWCSLLDTDGEAPRPKPWACWWTGRARHEAPALHLLASEAARPPARVTLATLAPKRPPASASANAAVRGAHTRPRSLVLSTALTRGTRAAGGGACCHWPKPLAPPRTRPGFTQEAENATFLLPQLPAAPA